MKYISNESNGNIQITDTETRRSEWLSLKDAINFYSIFEILGFNYVLSFINTVDNEYFEVIEHVKGTVLKSKLAGLYFNVDFVLVDNREGSFIDVTESCNQFCKQRGIKKQRTVYYPKRDAKILKDSNGCRSQLYYEDSNKKMVFSNGVMNDDLKISDRVYFNTSDNNLYFVVVNKNTNRAKFFRMADLVDIYESFNYEELLNVLCK